MTAEDTEVLTVQNNLAQLLDLYINFGSFAGDTNFFNALRNTADYRDFLAQIKGDFQKLQGSQKQVTWAEEIRDRQSKLFALDLTFVKFMEISQAKPVHYQWTRYTPETPIAKMLVPSSFDIEVEMQFVERNYAFLKSNSAKEIIDERYTKQMYFSYSEALSRLEEIHNY